MSDRPPQGASSEGPHKGQRPVGDPGKEQGGNERLHRRQIVDASYLDSSANLWARSRLTLLPTETPLVRSNLLFGKHDCAKGLMAFTCPRVAISRQIAVHVA